MRHQQPGPRCLASLATKGAGSVPGGRSSGFGPSSLGSLVVAGSPHTVAARDLQRVIARRLVARAHPAI
eukprot:11209290-Lingulodinium_polyedra.AAC.1